LYKVVALGGTFDHFHKGHREMIDRAFELGNHVIIGITTDDFVKRLGKSPDWPFAKRRDAVEKYVKAKFPNRSYELAPLDDFFGPAALRRDVEAIVVSPGTAERVALLNGLRAERGLPPVRPVEVPYVIGEDGLPISSTRIRRGEIDEEGRIIDQG